MIYMYNNNNNNMCTVFFDRYDMKGKRILY